MKRVVLLLGLIIFVVAIIQNSQSIALVFFGYQIPWELPLSLWIFLFMAAGALTSMLLQFLNLTAARSAAKEIIANNISPPPPSPPRSPKPPQTSSFADPESQDRQREFPSRKTKAEPVEDRSFDADPDRWKSSETMPQEDLLEDPESWDIAEEPPQEPTTVEKFDPSLDKYKSTGFEARQEPKNISRSGSIYSYTYKQAERRPKPKTDPPPPRENTQSKPIDPPNYSQPSNNNPSPDPVEPDYQEREEYSQPQKSERVYDAKYRVITPPYRDLPYEPLNDDREDEEWI
ncbi:MAG: lipopolysaccharide assembly LapA domain-containing protein [Prochloraceae cyanobacterium]